MGTIDLMAVLGLIGVGIETVAAVSNKWAHEGLARWRQRWLSWPPIIFGAVLAVASLRVSHYPVGDDVRVVGVPFMVVILKFERGHWIDLTSLLSPLAILGNIVFAALLPQVLVFLARKSRRKAGQGCF